MLLCGWDLRRLQLPLAEVRDGVDDDPWYAAAKVDNFVEDEAHNARRERRVRPPKVPGRPLLLEPIELVKVRSSVQKFCGVVEGAPWALNDIVGGGDDDEDGGGRRERNIRRFYADLKSRNFKFSRRN